MSKPPGKGPENKAVGDAATVPARPKAPAPTSELAAVDPAIDVTLTDPGASERVAVEPAEQSIDLRQVAEGEFQVVGEVARGGMGRILQARDRRHQRDVAIKELLSPSAAGRTRFTREALITARLQHPSIVPIYELASWRNGEPFYSMKLVHGRPLSIAISEANTVAKRLALLPKVINAVEAIAYAHQQRVIHRDLKPSNILVGDFGETVVIDWGLAKDLSDDDDEPVEPSESSQSDLTVAGSVIGTPSYMPLEQAVGESLDERADVYALGAILYHLASGEPPFRAESGDAVLELVKENPPTPLGALDVEIPADLVTIIDKAMARRREQRYASAVELAGELERFTTGQLVGAHRYSVVDLIRRRLRRHRAAFTVSAVALIAVLVLSVFSITQIVSERNQARAARSDAEASRVEAENQRERAEGLADFMIADLSEKLGPTGDVGLLEDVATRALAYASTGDPDAVPTIERQRRVSALLGNIRRGKGDHAHAENRFREELVFAKRLVAKEQSAQARVYEAAAHRRVAGALADQGRKEAALAELERSKELLEGLKEVDVVFDAVAVELGEVFTVKGNLDSLVAEGGGRFAAGIADIAIASEWDEVRSDPKKAVAMLQVRIRLASEIAASAPADALAVYDDVARKRKTVKLPKTVDSRLRMTLALKRGEALTHLERSADATRAFDEAIAIGGTELATDRALALGGKANLANSPVRAEKLRKKAIVLIESGPHRTADFQRTLGELHADIGLSLFARGKTKAGKKELTVAVELLGKPEIENSLSKELAAKLATVRAALSK